MWRAADIGTYFKFAAIAAFQVMATDPGITDAIYLLGRIKTLGGDVVSERDMHRACQSRFPKKDALLAAIDRLVDHGYLLPQTAPAKGQGSTSVTKIQSPSLGKTVTEMTEMRDRSSTDRLLSFLSLVLPGTNSENAITRKVVSKPEGHPRHEL